MIYRVIDSTINRRTCKVKVGVKRAAGEREMVFEQEVQVSEATQIELDAIVRFAAALHVSGASLATVRALTVTV